MKPKHHKIEQNTEEWMALRCGRFTASTFKNLFVEKSKAGYNNEIYRVVFERLTGETPDSYTSKDMDRGHEVEPFARKEYEMASFNDTQDGGFWSLGKYIGASPDALINGNGLLEIKCPKYSTMIPYLLNPKLPNEYKWQTYGQLYVTQREWLDFIAYHPLLKPLIIRVYPDKEIFTQLETELNIAIEKVEEIIERLK